ncbi:dienelactone hydrolase family protein [Phenylobacterium sp.]|uniref:dienelactone hydrolase family protein n=1 Tax=Phenylobacterium sp. TaxID=1871053 RepID=UPI003BAD1045
MEFIGEKTEDGVTRREFRLTVDGDAVPGVIWTPEGAEGPRPLILMGHGGSQHKKVANLTAAAIGHAQKLGYATVAIDAPGHGDRITREQAEKARAAAAEAGRAAQKGERPAAPSRPSRDAAVAVKHVAEWKATLDAVQGLDEIGAGQPVGYWGVSMGTRFGVPFVADEPRITCATFGLFGVFPGLEDHRAAAERIRIPLMFVFQWEDELMTREQGLALFNAFGSSEKTMHINPGRHVEIPAHEREAWLAFWKRHLERP